LVVSRPIAQRTLERESELLVAFVNTRDLDEDTEALASPADVEGWIAGTAPELGTLRIDETGRARIVALREAVRALLRANNGGEAGQGELAPMREAARGGRLRAAIGKGGEVRIEPAVEGAAALEARVVLAIARVQELGGWPRLKACPADDCQWAFVDSSRNRSRTWCSMEVCGNRSKTRRYRERRST
jgi:predicted RNA-binding Zn ribbon-like protein